METERQRAIQSFIQDRSQEGSRRYERIFRDLRPLVVRLFLSSQNLRRFEPAVIANDPALLAPARFLVAPPISEDDLNTLTGTSVAKRKTMEETLAKRATEVIAAAWDPRRFPWIADGRNPAQVELDSAIDWTTSIFAIERLRTLRRTESAKRQQNKVMAALRSAGWQEHPRQPLATLDQLPRTHFCPEVTLAGIKCDIPVRLHDGRILAIECKVSNSATNSVKRLIRETCGKAQQWRREFGNQVITGALLAGVFKLANLTQAQNEEGVAIFWEHDLQPLLDFVGPGDATTITHPGP